MAKDFNAGADAGDSGARPVSQFKPFKWVPQQGLDPSRQHQAAFLNDARDVVQGALLLVQLLQWDEERCEAVSSETDPAPFFDACQRNSLQRFVAVSLGLLHARIEAQCEAMRE
ncbi:hypothetical protein [Variovorax paradoxus]|uniref:hypothetical protein n=1 Tax=Variovorax paradoxus TaxID=34073 RepID=UPI00193151C9|nr:hypothetical protein INQ48_09385 [Variovorax paradoxus]